MTIGGLWLQKAVNRIFFIFDVKTLKLTIVQEFLFPTFVMLIEVYFAASVS